MLRRRHVRLTTEIAREAIIARDGDIEAALEYFKAHPRVYGINIRILLLMIQIAVEFWKVWNENGLDEPSTVLGFDELQVLSKYEIAEDDDE
jgi:hypothetical protein